MAKGRRLTTSRSERYLGSYGSHSHAQSNGRLDALEYREEDVWQVVDDVSTSHGDDGVGSESEWASRASSENGGFVTRPRIPRRDRHVGGLSLAFEDSSNGTTSSRILHQLRTPENGTGSQRRHHMATSAPMNVPDWNRILRVNSVESLHDSDDGFDDYDPSEMTHPPHEYLARSRKTTATSVFEGVGRTLKGRDMSRLRDAVWSQTGFDG